jgi:hypothetical protein
MRQHFRRLERRMGVADVEQPGFDRFQAFAQLADRAAEGLGPFDFVACLLGDALCDLRHEHVAQGRDPEPGGRMAGTDLELEGGGVGAAAARAKQGGGERREPDTTNADAHDFILPYPAIVAAVLLSGDCRLDAGGIQQAFRRWRRHRTAGLRPYRTLPRAATGYTASTLPFRAA